MTGLKVADGTHTAATGYSVTQGKEVGTTDRIKAAGAISGVHKEQATLKKIEDDVAKAVTEGLDEAFRNGFDRPGGAPCRVAPTAIRCWACGGLRVVVALLLTGGLVVAVALALHAFGVRLLVGVVVVVVVLVGVAGVAGAAAAAVGLGHGGREEEGEGRDEGEGGVLHGISQGLREATRSARRKDQR